MGYGDIIVFGMLIISSLLIELNYKNYRLENEVLIFYLASLMLFLIAQGVDVKLLVKYLPLIVTTLFLFELGMGIKQIFTASSVDALAISLSGTLLNSGIYSIFLVVCFPFVLYCISNAPILNSPIKATITFSLTLLLFYILSSTISRTAIFLAVFFCGCHFYSMTRKLKLTFLNHLIKFKIAYLFLASGIFLLSSIGLLFLKFESVNGRLLIWKITLENWRDYIFTGVGIGNFAYNYSYWQMEYVRDNKLSQDAILNLDDSKVAFNEFIQLFVETGVIGLIGVLYFMFVLLGLKARAKQFEAFHLTLKISISLILAASLSSYPFHSNSLLFLFFVSVAALLSTSSIRLFSIKGKSYLFIAPVIFIYSVLLFRTYKMEKAVSAWMELAENFHISPDKKKIQYYSLYPMLCENGKFLLDFGEWLLYNGYYSESIDVLEKSKSKLIAERTYLATATSYEQMKDYSRAIDNLEKLCNLVPYKIVPKASLMKLYFVSGDTLNGKRIAKVILDMPIKVANPEIDRIKSEIMIQEY
ncbi:MAG: O-antigen ligase family protein [Chitinophagaceae bacterium]|nr:O-antigen ligase family protein [Chitinophagaceae bacterium]